MDAAVNIERFPAWNTRPQRVHRPVIDWVALGSEYDIGHIVRLWQRVMRFHIDQLQDDESIMWQLADKLQDRRSDIVRIQAGDISIDRQHMADFREQIDFIWDHIADEHGEQRYAWCRDAGDYVRIQSEQAPITELEDARRVHDIIKALYGGWADSDLRVGGQVMAPRKPKTADPVVVADPAPAQPAIYYIANPVTVAGQTPRTRDEIAIRDAVRKALSEVETLIADFVTEKKSERLTGADIDELFVLELPIQLRYRNVGGRIRVSYGAAIVDRQA